MGIPLFSYSGWTKSCTTIQKPWDELIPLQIPTDTGLIWVRLKIQELVMVTQVVVFH